MSINGIAIGDGGGIAVATETIFGTPAVTPIWQHPISAGLKPAKQLRPPKQLCTVKPTTRDYIGLYGAGPIVVGWNPSRAIVGPILAAFGSLSTNDYTFGDGGTPDEESCTAWVDTGGHMMRYTGAVPISIRWDFTADGIITMTVDWMTQKEGKIVSLAVTNPDEADIAMVADLADITLGGNDVCVLGGYIQVVIPHEGTDRICLGSSYIKKPQRRGLHDCTGVLNVELSDEAGNDTEAELDHYLLGTSAGDLVIGDWTMAGCYVTGEAPALAEGITKFPINLEGQSVVLTTAV